VRSVFGDVQDVSEGLRAYTLKLLGPAVEKIGWEFAPNEDLLTGQLRAMLIAQAGISGHQPTIDEATKRFKAYNDGDTSAIHPSLRSPIFRIAVTHGGCDAYEAVKKFYLNTKSVDGKEIALQSLGRVQTPELATEYLDFNFSDKVAVQDRHSAAIALAANGKTRLALWEYVKAHWDDKVFATLSGNMVVLERFLRVALNKFASYEVKKDIESFFEGKNQRGYDRGLGVVKDTIEGQAKYKERDVEVVREWLNAHGYLA
jgi:aminopeptidase N